ncbi:MAG: protein phosphatase 2C domain-containing protein [Thermoguttaceae bacterium]|nr:protein phosphatase 2C domain-containing protein [Thermoguttaceae bacterium]MBR0191049.1 protein phosphatase 2C domain-containing protein [Thermoguttaceae bacterium]
MWKLVKCAVQGRGHVKAGTPCQDKVCTYTGNGVSVIALADGAGSARLSHFGAQRVTQFVCEEFSDHFDDWFQEPDGVLVKKQLVQKILEQLTDLRQELNCELRDLASTLLVVAAKEDCFLLIHIGDGVIGYWRDGELKVASHPENGEFANITFFTTSSNAISTMKIAKGNLGNIAGFVLMSDGTAESFYSHQTSSLAGVLAKIMKMTLIFPQEKIEKDLLESFEQVVIQRTHDDCSLALMVRPTDSFTGFEDLSQEEKCDVLEINMLTPDIKKKLARYTKIMRMINRRPSCTLVSLSREIHLKPKYTRKYLMNVLRCGLIQSCKNGHYKSSVK